jgi:hypothetical protein
MLMGPLCGGVIDGLCQVGADSGVPSSCDFWRAIPATGPESADQSACKSAPNKPGGASSEDEFEVHVRITQIAVRYGGC